MIIMVVVVVAAEMVDSRGVVVSMTTTAGMEGEGEAAEEVTITITSIAVRHHHQDLQGIHTITIEEEQILITEVTCVPVMSFWACELLLVALLEGMRWLVHAV